MSTDSQQNGSNEAGETKLFMSLVLSGQRKIYLYILSLVIHPADADDILQESESAQVDNLSERIEIMKGCVKKLSEKELALLNMRYQEDFSFKKMALTIGISKQSVYRSISRIHAKLVKCIKYTLRMGALYEY